MFITEKHTWQDYISVFYSMFHLYKRKRFEDEE